MYHAIVRGLRDRGVDVITAFEARRLGLPDEEQLRFATSEGRAIYSANVADFARIHARWLRTGLHHTGLVLLSDQRTNLGVQIAALVRIANELTAQTAADRLAFLKDWIA